MAQTKFVKGSTEWNLLGDFFHLCERNFGIEDNDEYWNSVTEEIDAFCAQYNNHPFAVELGMSMAAYLEKTAIAYRKEEAEAAR